MRPDENISKNAAGRLIGTCMVRNKKGLANYDQIRRLADIGIHNAVNMYAAKAADILRAHYETERARGRQRESSWGNQRAAREPGEEG